MGRGLSVPCYRGIDRNMVRKVFPFILICFWSSQAFGLSVLSTDSGPSQQNIKDGVSEGIFDSMAKHAGDWLATGMDKIGNWAIQTLFKIYDKYIGTFLIFIPDLASPKTY